MITDNEILKKTQRKYISYLRAYLNEEDFVWTDGNGISRTLKYFRVIPDYNLDKTLKLSSFDQLDEIASRQDIFGDGGESNTYKLAEFNRTKLLEADFVVANVKEINIPL